MFQEEDETTSDDAAVTKINAFIEDHLGIFDSELVQQILEIGREHANPHDFLMAINESELKVFNFSEEMLFDFWAAIRDSTRSPSASNSTVSPPPVSFPSC